MHLTSFAFSKLDLSVSFAIALTAIAAIAWSEAKGTPLPLMAFLSICIVFANVFVTGYFNAKRERRALEWQLRIEAQPLLELKSELIRELSAGHKRVERMKEEAERLEAAAAINSLHEAAVRSLLSAVVAPTRRSVWAERTFGFFSGVAASLLASAIYEVARS